MGTSSRDGELCPADPKRGKAWKAYQGFHIRAPVLTGLLAMACASSATSLAGKDAATLSLAAADGSRISLQELWRGRTATVLVFWSSGCPCVRRYQSRMDSLLDKYPAERVHVVGVSSNAGEDYSEVVRIARERGVRIPILRDEAGEVAQILDVHSTPTAVVIDGSGRIRFLGWIDNERLPGDHGREAWLELAIEGLLEDRAFAARTPVYGCAITRSLFSPSSNNCCHEKP